MTSSDLTTTIEDLRQRIRAFITARDWDQFHTPKDLAIALSVETAELLELFRFQSDTEINTRLADPAYYRQVQHELADCLFFILAFANNLNIDLSEATAAKLEVSARNYPVDLARGRNTKYTQLR